MVFMLLFHGGVWVLELNQNILLVFLECDRYKTNLFVKALFDGLVPSPSVVKHRRATMHDPTSIPNRLVSIRPSGCPRQ